MLLRDVSPNFHEVEIYKGNSCSCSKHSRRECDIITSVEYAPCSQGHILGEVDKQTGIQNMIATMEKKIKDTPKKQWLKELEILSLERTCWCRGQENCELPFSSTNKTLLELNSHVHLFTYCLWLLITLQWQN